jgi:hypothetical protein
VLRRADAAQHFGGHGRGVVEIALVLRHAWRI